MSKEYLLKSMNTSMDINVEQIPQYSFIGENIKIIVEMCIRDSNEEVIDEDENEVEEELEVSEEMAI